MAELPVLLTADEAAAEWTRRFSQGNDPTEIREEAIPTAELTDGKMGIVKLLVRTGLVKSNNEARNLLGPKSGVTIGPDRQKITEPTALIELTDGLIVRVGNRRIVRIRLG